jgi:ubiquinone biosynthesis monooxygenase Coq7
MTTRKLSPLDRLLVNLDQGVRTVFGKPQTTDRPNPARGLSEAELADGERRHTARLMRINHTGEVCAQGLYQGQALTARLPDVRQRMARSAQEENDHLDWCATRIEELGDRKSLLNPFWYAGSFAIGALAGLAGDKWSLGFVVETERQVEHHLDGHLDEISLKDEKTRAILLEMKADEIHHADVAKSAGGAALPAPVKLAMKLSSKVMTRTVYWI